METDDNLATVAQLVSTYAPWATFEGFTLPNGVIAARVSINAPVDEFAGPKTGQPAQICWHVNLRDGVWSADVAEAESLAVSISHSEFGEVLLAISGRAYVAVSRIWTVRLYEYGRWKGWDDWLRWEDGHQLDALKSRQDEIWRSATRLAVVLRTTTSLKPYLADAVSGIRPIPKKFDMARTPWEKIRWNSAVHRMKQERRRHAAWQRADVPGTYIPGVLR